MKCNFSNEPQGMAQASFSCPSAIHLQSEGDKAPPSRSIKQFSERFKFRKLGSQRGEKAFSTRGRVLAVFLLLLFLTGCAEHATQAQELEPAHTHPAQTQHADAPEITEVSETSELQEEPDYGDAAFCGGVTLFAGSPIALVNSEEARMEGAPFFEGDEFYVPLRFAAETLGWHYAEDGDTITLSATKTWEWGVDFAPDGGWFLRPCEPVTQVFCFTVGSAAITRNGEAVENTSMGAPARRDGVVYLPLDFRSGGDGFGLFDYQSIPVQEDGTLTQSWLILNGQRNEAGLGGFHIWQNWDEIPAEQREGFVESGMLGQSSIGEYNVVEYTRGGLSVHVLRPMAGGTEFSGDYDGAITGVYASDPNLATPRGLRPGDPWEKVEQVYDGRFADTLSLRLDEEDNIVELGLHSPYYDSPPAGCRTLSDQHMFHDWMAHPEDAPDNWDPVTKDLDD